MNVISKLLDSLDSYLEGKSIVGLRRSLRRRRTLASLSIGCGYSTRNQITPCFKDLQ